MPDVDQVEVVLANIDRVTLRVGDVFLKIDADQARRGSTLDPPQGSRLNRTRVPEDA